MITNKDLGEYYCFIKLGPKNRLETLQKTGKLYMKNLKYFINLEEQTGEKGRGDKQEASQLIIKKHELFINGEEIEISPPPGIIRDERHLNSPIFCLMYKNIFSNCIKDTYPTFEFNIQFDEKVFSDFKDDQLPHALFIHNPEIFFNRVDVAIEKLKVFAKRAPVKYRDKRVPHIVDCNIILDDVFTKDISFKHQEEYRILLDMEVEDHFVLEIGNIEDISNIYDCRKIKNGLHVQFNVKEII